MRGAFWMLLILLTASSGCKTVEVAVDYPLPLASVHIVAKIEARDVPRVASEDGARAAMPDAL